MVKLLEVESVDSDIELDSDEVRKAFERVKEKSEDDFEKYITYISAGALALSMTFIEKIVPLKESIYTWMVLSAWVLFGLTLIVNLFSHYLSKILIIKTIDDLDNLVPNINEKVKKRNYIIDGVNISTLCSLSLGIGILLAFVYLNINEMSKESRPKTITGKSVEQAGRTIPKVPTSSKPNAPSNSTKK